MKLLINHPLSWKTTISFLSLATLLILLISWLTISGVLPIKMAIDYSPKESNFIRIWVFIAIFVGILLPGTAFFAWIRHREPRKVLGFYLLVLLVQIVSERVLSRVLFSSIVVPIGTIYTVFRLGQLWQGQKLLAAHSHVVPYRKLMYVLLWLILLFWLSNLIMLLVLPWRLIL